MRNLQDGFPQRCFLVIYPIDHSYIYWLVVWNMFFMFPYIGNGNPNWLIFFRGVETVNQFTINHGSATYISTERYLGSPVWTNHNLCGLLQAITMDEINDETRCQIAMGYSLIWVCISHGSKHGNEWNEHLILMFKSFSE